MLPVIMGNVKTFRKVGAHLFGTQREGDQFGTLFAGAWSLTHDEPASEADAKAMMSAYDFKEHTEDAEQDDAMKALEALMGAKLKVGNYGDLTIFELIREGSTLYKQDLLETKLAINALARHGIRCDYVSGRLLFGTSVNNLKQLVKDMPFVTDLRGQLMRVPGAHREEKPMKFNGITSRAISIPLLPLLAEVELEPPI